MKGRVPEDTTADSVPPPARGGRGQRLDELCLGLGRETNSNNMWVSSSVERIKSTDSLGIVRKGDWFAWRWEGGSFEYEPRILVTKTCR